ncbi:MAG: hypothetical protein LBJ44_06135 [Propionibacteriaceae bacterium]|jgi:hypothetical protein|nr:hypothetical protein [Propionibacteriaceae bacterium]
MFWHHGARRHAVRWLVGCLLALLACGSMAAPRAWAAPQNCTIQITHQAPDGAGFLVEGTLHDSSERPISGLVVNVLIDGVQVGSGPTGSTGFSVRVARPTTGSHVLSVQWPGNDQWSSSNRSQPIDVPSPVTTEMTLSADPSTVPVGGSFSISGTLTSRGSPVDGALIEVGLSWGGDSPATVMTSANGSFDAYLGVPEGENPPSGLSVTARFAGDGYYPAASQNVQLAVTVPAPSATPETSPSPTESGSPRPTSSATATSTSTATAGSPPSSTFDFSSPLFILAMVFFVVVVLATGTLLVIAVVSHRHTALAADEQRGFGSDFGSDQPDDEGSAGADGPDAAERTAAAPGPGPTA